MTPCMQRFAGEVWDYREEGSLSRDPAKLARGLALAVARDVEGQADYDPEQDLRVRWARDVIGKLRCIPSRKQPKAEPGLEMAVMMLLGRLEQESAACGKALAAGGSVASAKPLHIPQPKPAGLGRNADLSPFDYETSPDAGATE